MEFNNLFFRNVYSAEAKKLITYSLLQKRAFVVSKKIKIASLIKKSLFYDIVKLGWGNEYLPFVTIEYSNSSSDDRLDFVEDKIINHQSLFVFHFNYDFDEPSVTISINHILADDYTMQELDNIITEYVAYGNDLKLKNRLLSGQEQYKKYVEFQSRYRERYSKIENSRTIFLEPIKLKKNMKWDRNCEWSNFVLNINTLDYESSLEKLFEILKFHNCIEGNMMSMSQNWRGEKYSNALGMMTGLLPYSFFAKQKLNIGTSLELLASCDIKYNKILSICYETDLYFSDSVHHVGCFEIQSNRFRFPVGVSFDNFKMLLKLEGCFSFPNEVKKILKEL